MISNNPDSLVLEARGISKVFNTGNMFSRVQVNAVENADLKLYRGRVTALVGESGSGKSTIIRMLARIYDPTAGEIYFKGQNVSAQKGRHAILHYRSLVQMIFQDPFSSLNPVHKIDHHLLRPLQIHHKGATSKERRTLVNELLERVKLYPPEDFAYKYPHELSGGQRQRVAIARALAVEPEVMLADEPVSMLDVSIRIGILNLLDELRRDYNMAVLYVTHDIASARYFAQEIAVMYAGHIIEQGESETVIQQPKHPYTQLLLSAVPDPERGLKTATPSSEVVNPSAKNIAPSDTGCPFASRCPHVMDICRSQMPDYVRSDDNQMVRCHLYPEETNVIAMP